MLIRVMSAVFALFAFAAQAASINVMHGGGVIGTLTCDNCSGYVYDGGVWTLSAAEATYFPKQKKKDGGVYTNSSPETEAALLNMITGGGYSAQNISDNKQEVVGGVDPATVPAGDFLMKLGNGWAAFSNAGGAPVSYSYTPASGAGAGLSHISGGGGGGSNVIAPVPLPMSAGLLAFGLVSIGALRRRG